MSFVKAKVSLHDAAAVRDGVIPAAQRLRVVEAQALIDQLLERARRQAEAVLDEARHEAAELLDQARHAREAADEDTRARAQLLLEQINQEWRSVVESLEPTAVTLARLAIERVCAGATLAERVDAATRAAIRELPDKPVRLRVCAGARDSVAAALSASLDVVEDPALEDGSVCLEGEQGACDASFSVAQATVTSFLGNWATRASKLMQHNQAPKAQQP